MISASDGSRIVTSCTAGDTCARYRSESLVRVIDGDVMIEFHLVDADSFSKYEAQILKSEKIFPEQIRTNRDDYLEILMSENSIAIVATVDGRYAGNIIGCPISEEDAEEYETGCENEREKIIYVYNIVIDEEYRGMGYGYELMREFIKIAKMRGYELLAGHFRKYGPDSLIGKLGGSERKVYANWEGSGEDYVFCVLDLKAVKNGDE